ncbi:MAG TPA: WecB/TagA/CpsF family glycosyltransferase [Solirubrobacteraceae bacterium]|nr:WecB/TagA/CpsF family glycosyltransferase [Solirubrobacteraceae bacterium]
MPEVKDDITQAPRQSRIFELPIELDPPDELLQRIIGWVGNGGPTKRVMYVNAHVINQSREDPALRAALEEADLVYCDGYGVRLAAKALNTEIPHRMTGADWIWDLAALCEAQQTSIYLLGCEPGVARQAGLRLRRTHPNLRIAGAHHGYFAIGSGHDDRVVEDINRCRPDIVLVGMGTPKQELWAQRTVDSLDCSVLWTVGALFDFVSGRVPRAPASLADNGLEWIFRLAIEPQRMWRRYLVGNPVFLSRVVTLARQRHRHPR